MSFEMSRAARYGHNHAASLTVFSESCNAQGGLPSQVSQMTPDEMVARLDVWATQLRLTPDDTDAWAWLASFACQCAGQLAEREEFSPVSGDEIARAA